MQKQKLELMWVGKEKRAKLEPRILIEDPEKSYHADKRVSDNDIFDNMLIHGDNLLALKALEQDYTGRVKCIYIDPPYNTGNAFEHYDDGLEHSIWLSLMRERLELLKNLLREDGILFVQIDDSEQAYLKVLLDETFGRANFINMLSVNMKNIAGASGGGEDKRIKKNCEYILIYAKNYDLMPLFNGPYEYTEMSELIQNYINEGKSWKYTTVLTDPGEKKYIGSTMDGDGNEIRVYKRLNVKMESINSIAKKEEISVQETYKKYGINVFRTTNAQSSIRMRIMEFRKKYNIKEPILSIEYIPRSGKNKGKIYEQFYKDDACNLFVWLRDTSEVIQGKLFKKELQGTYWDMNAWMKNLTKEGNVAFPNGKKPEKLIEQIFSMSTNPGDLVLDSFLGSGTTAAVAHKMGRRWIGIELGEHCDTHCVPRLKKVIDGEDAGGITKSANWRGGGGFRYYNLAPSLVKFDEWGNPIINKEFNENMLVRALCKVEGFNFDPSPDVYWKQGKSTESDFIYVTTQHLTAQMLQKLSDDVGDSCTLLICCGSFDGKKDSYSNLTIKKIPKAILKKCEWNHDDYSLEIKNLPMSAPDPQPSPAPRKKSFKKLPPDSNQLDLF